MSKTICRVTLIIALILFSISVAAKPILLRRITIHKNTPACDITFHLSAFTHYRTFMLHNPNRFIIDLKNVKTYHLLRLNLASQTAIQYFRYATHRDGVFRVVFGLKSAQKPTVRVLSSPKTDVKLMIVFASSAKSLKKPLTMTSFIKQEEQSIITEVNDANPNKKYRQVIVVIDPGHGGKDPGATGPGGTHEKNIVLSIAKILQAKINRQPGFRAVLTRTGDYYLTLRQRLAIARHDKADMFIAIHADIFRNKTAQGVSIFALSQKGATSEAARWLATRENASELMGGVDLHDQSHLLKSVLINLSQSATIRSSLEIGHDVMQSVKPIARMHHNRVEQAAFVVLKSPDIPSLLVETGFLSNPKEEKRLRTVAYQTQLATALMRGIRQYFDYYPPRGTWLSYWRYQLKNKNPYINL